MGGRRETTLGLLAALGFLLLAAGCLGGSGDEAALNSTDVNETDAALEGTDAAGANGTQGLGFEGPTRETTISDSGTFTLGDGAFVGGAVRGTDMRQHDLTSEVPTNAPVTVNVTITYDGETSQLNGEWLLENVEVFDTHYVKSFETNTIWMEASLARTSNAGSVVAVVQADLAGESPERQYSIEATISSQGDASLAGVPTSVPVTEDSGGFVIEARGGQPLGSVAVWDPQGTMQRLEPTAGSVSLTVSSEDPLGRYVVLPTPADDEPGVASAPLTVQARNASGAPSAPLKVVEVETREGSWNSVSHGGTAEWSFRQNQAPIQAGMRARPTQPVSTTGLGTLDVQLSSPAGTVIEGSLGGFYLGPVEEIWLTDVGAPNLVAGNYNATASLSEGASSWEVSHFVRELKLP